MLTFRRFGTTLGERIANVVLVTRAHRYVVDDTTERVEATRTGTRISTLLLNAGLIAGTFGINEALRVTVRRLAHKLT